MNNDLISRKALKEDFKSRLARCDEWIKKAKDEGTRIRADATKHFICEVIMTIDKAPTAKSSCLMPKGEWINPSENPEFSNKDFFNDCSLCGHTQMDKSNFCPNCGAYMQVKLELNNELNELNQDKEQNERLFNPFDHRTIGEI